MSPEALLTLSSMSALYQIFQSYLDTNFPGVVALHYRPSEPIAVEGTLTEVIFTLDRSKTPLSAWDSQRLFRIRYHRLELNKVVTSETPVPAHLPLSNHDLVSAYLRRYSVPLDLNELEGGTVTEHGLVTVTASTDSYRWVGSATLATTLDNRDLADLAEHKRIVTNFSPEYSSAHVKRDLVIHLNRQNAGRGLPPVSLGDVQICCPITDGQIDDRLNTCVKIRAVSDLYRGEVELKYRRRHFMSTWRKPVEVLWDGWSDIHESLNAISLNLGCQVVGNDVVNQEYNPPQYKQPTEVVIQFKSESMGYIGELKVLFHV